MRLLQTTTYQLETFIQDVPPYAILSHTWGEGEVLFKDITDPEPEVRHKLWGWDKIVNCCRRAAKDGWHYIWIDTCCIDKSDTVELGEAINSMFRWYEEAQVCYAFLADVPALYRSGNTDTTAVPWRWHFRSSRWFTRGWTLQELLAPTFLFFIDSSWGVIGSREEWASEIYNATGIEYKQLCDFRSYCLATKLSWAAHRKTTREEDRAYSLLGLLGVNMPLIYGEGKRAFIRLQHELIRSYNDETIFAWGNKPPSGNVFRATKSLGILAPSPEMFADSNSLVTWPFERTRRGFAMINAGLSMNAEVFRFPGQGQGVKSLYAIKLNCSWAWPPLDAYKTPLILFLRDATSDTTPCSLSGNLPVLFQRTGEFLTHWGELSSSHWESLGRHDILIQEDGGRKTIQATAMEYTIALKGSARVSLDRIFNATKCFRKDNVTQKWATFTPNRQEGAYRVSRAEVLVDNISVSLEIPGDIGNDQRNPPPRHILLTLTILLKWTPRSLSFGIWEYRCWADLANTEKMNQLLESDQERPFPQSVKLPGNHAAVRVMATPRPDNSRLRRSFDLAVTVEDCRPDSSVIPLYRHGEVPGVGPEVEILDSI